MVKRSKKSKSKRITLRKKHKIFRKVKEHHKKKAKEAKKLGLRRKKVEKDPGIPSDWPFKEQELKLLELRREKAIEELEQKKAARKERAHKRKLGLLDDHDISQSIVGPSDGVHDTKNDEEEDARAMGNHGHLERSFYKELLKVIEASDVIVEVLDARDPIGTRCVDMEKLVMKMDPNKRLVLLLNKIDLVPREAVEKWLKYLREEEQIAVAFKCNMQQQRSNLGWRSASTAAKASKILQTSDCLGAETVMKLLKNYSRSCELKLSITVGIVGLPNVGKSSVINSLKRSHVVNVGATPGLTRSMQEVRLDKNVKLLDCPGVVMLKSVENDASIALHNCKRIEKLDDPITPVKEILKLCAAESLMAIYKLPCFNGVDDFLQKVAMARGKLKRGGIVDMEAAARMVLHEWNEGKIPYYTLPPLRDGVENLESRIVSEFGKEFNVGEVYKRESSFIGSLPSVDDFGHIEVPPGSSNVYEQMIEEDGQDEYDAEKNDNCGATAPMACDVEDPSEKRSNASSKQNEKLYTAEGILDPSKKRKAKKKRRKAQNEMNAIDADYDFKFDYQQKQPGPLERNDEIESEGQDT